MIGASPDTGATMLEVLVALGIFAGLLAVTMSAIGPTAPPTGDGDAVARFIANARSDAILTGAAKVLAIGPAGLSSGDKRLVLSGSTPTEPERLLIYPDGVLAGEVTAFARAAGLTEIGGVFTSTSDD